MLYLLTISEQHSSIYEVLVHKLKQLIKPLDILSMGHLAITLDITYSLDTYARLSQDSHTENKPRPHFSGFLICPITVT